MIKIKSMSFEPEILKAQRVKSGYTLREIEEQTGVSNAYLSMLENGKIKNPSFNVIMKLTEFYAQERAKMIEYDRCPNCLSTNIKDVSMRGSNGIFGPGSKAWVEFEAMMCENCGILFRKPVRK